MNCLRDRIFAVQVRVGNKQDEASVRALVCEVLGVLEQKLDLHGSDSDLKSVESHYFGHDGVFLVAEENRIIFGFAAGVRKSDTVCELKRLYIQSSRRRTGLGSQLLNQVITFARDAGYDEILAVESDKLPNARTFLTARGFTASGGAELTMKLR